MIIMETNPSMYMIIVVAIITATTFTTAQTTEMITAIESTPAPGSSTTGLTTDVGTTSSSLTTSTPDSPTETTTGGASTMSFTTNPSSSSSSLMTTIPSTAAGTPASSSLTTSETDSPTDSTTGDASTTSFTTNPSSSSSSLTTTIPSTDAGTTTSSSLTTSETDSTTDTTTGDANTLSFTTNPSSSSSSVTTIPSIGSTFTPSSLISTMSTDSTAMTTSASYTTSTSSDQSSPTEPPTEAPTQPLTEAPTEALTQPPTDSPTEAPTQPLTEAPTEALTQPPTEALTEPPAKSPTAPPVETTMTTMAKVGPVPEPTFPDLGGDAVKTYQFEFAVAENTTVGCSSTNLSSADCEIFKLDITEELEDVYSQSIGFESIEVVLRAGSHGSIIVSHKVIYTYNDMTDEDRQASAQTIYDQTLGQAVDDGKLGNYSVIENCQNCTTAEETSNICDSTFEPPCQPSKSKPTCMNDNYWICESVCNTNYCNGKGICWQVDLTSEPICSCDWDNGEWYWGYKCQFYANQMHLIIGCSCGAAVLLVIIVSCLVYICTKTCYKADKATSAKSSESGNDDVIHAFHNFGYDHDHKTETANFPPIEDFDEGDILQRSRPYSYIYTGKGDDNANMDPTLIIKNQNGGAQRESRLEINDDAAAKRLSNGSSDPRHSSFLKSNGGYQQRAPEFWGNLDETGVSEAIKLEPVLDHIDVNESYKIQRPRISTNYSYSNSAQPNLYHSVGTSDHETHFIPEADYAQR